jgi:hypothetical protein
MDLQTSNSPLSSPTPEMLSAFLKEIEQERAPRRTENALAYYRSYAKQREFHAAGLSARERLLMAGNQLGKTIAGGFEAAMHATGRYPDWWQGRRFDQPTIAWVAGVTGESMRDNPQRILLGRSGQHGTCAIPKDAVANASRCLGNPAFRPATFRAPAREFRLYHRDGGKVVKLRDDLISATRYALMCLRFAKPAGESRFARKLEYPALGIV